MNKSTVLHALESYAKQRPGLDFANYGDVSAYRSESRSITKDLHNVLELLSAVSWRDSITGDDIIKASESAFSGRLSLIADGESLRIEYCTGQYFPTEYRRAVCAVLSRVLWQYWASDLDTGDQVRKAARDNLSRSVTTGYFN